MAAYPAPAIILMAAPPEAIIIGAVEFGEEKVCTKATVVGVIAFVGVIVIVDMFFM